MPVSIASSGAQVATVTTEHTLAAVAGPTGGGHYQLRVDVSVLALGDRLTVVCQSRVRAADTTRDEFTVVLEHIPHDKILTMPAIAVPNGCEFIAKLTQNAGSSRTFPWAVYRLDA